MPQSSRPLLGLDQKELNVNHWQWIFWIHLCTFCALCRLCKIGAKHVLYIEIIQRKGGKDWKSQSCLKFLRSQFSEDANRDLGIDSRANWWPNLSCLDPTGSFNWLNWLNWLKWLKWLGVWIESKFRGHSTLGVPVLTISLKVCQQFYWFTETETEWLLMMTNDCSFLADFGWEWKQALKCTPSPGNVANKCQYWYGWHKSWTRQIHKASIFEGQGGHSWLVTLVCYLI